MDDATRRKLRNRLRRAQGQLTAVERELEENEDCVALLHQLSAVEGALAKARAVLLNHHIESCVSDALRSGGGADRAEIIDELMELIGRQIGR